MDGKIENVITGQDIIDFIKENGLEECCWVSATSEGGKLYHVMTISKKNIGIVFGLEKQVDEEE